MREAQHSLGSLTELSWAPLGGVSDEIRSCASPLLFPVNTRPKLILAMEEDPLLSETIRTKPFSLSTVTTHVNISAHGTDP